MVTRIGLPFGERVDLEDVGVAAPEFEDVPDLDAAPDLQLTAPPSGHGSPARTSAASIVPSGVKSRPATTLTACLPASFAPVSHAVPLRRADRRGSGARGVPLRADVAPDQGRGGGEVVEQRDRGRVQVGFEPFQVDVAVAGQPDASSSACRPGG